MALKIKQNGEVKDLIIPACGVQILDMEDNFESSNLEEVLQEIGEGESIYVSDKEPDKDGIWISSDNTTTAGENQTLLALKAYLNEKLGTAELTTDDKTIKGAINKHEKQIKENSAQLSESAYYQNIEIKKYRNKTNTCTYWITTVKIDNSIKIKTGFANDDMSLEQGHSGEIVRDFAYRKGTTLAINGGVADAENKRIIGTIVKDGEVIQNHPMKNHEILGIKNDNTLVVYPYDTTAEKLIADGCVDSQVGYFSIITNGAKNTTYVDNSDYTSMTCRQVIAQKNDKTIIILTVDGRTNGSVGMELSECTDILLNYNVNMAYVLDGGGSVQTVFRNKLINSKYDSNNTVERKVINFMYIDYQQESSLTRDKDLKESNYIIGENDSTLKTLIAQYNEMKTNYDKMKTNYDKMLPVVLFDGDVAEIETEITLSDKLTNYKHFIISFGGVGGGAYTSYHVYPYYYGKNATIENDFKYLIQRDILGTLYYFVLEVTSAGNLKVTIRDTNNTTVLVRPNGSWCNIRKVIGFKGV